MWDGRPRAAPDNFTEPSLRVPRCLHLQPTSRGDLVMGGPIMQGSMILPRIYVHKPPPNGPTGAPPGTWLSCIGDELARRRGGR